MKVGTRRIALAAWAFFLFLVAFAQTESRDPALPNFHQVSPGLYRGAQPKKGGLKKLKAKGVKTIINLRGEDANTRAESEESRNLGLNYFAIALPEHSRPHDADVLRVLSIINAPENQPVFVHCRRGSDRTGTIVSCYRIAREGWTAAQARHEAESHGMNWTQLGMKHYIDDFYQRLYRKQRAER